MSRYIDATELNGYKFGLISPYAQKLFHKTIDDAHTADVRENTHGEWILVQREEKYIDIVCNKCGFVRVKDYAYGYKIEELDMEEVKNLCIKNHLNFCECCGADMKRGGHV